LYGVIEIAAGHEPLAEEALQFVVAVAALAAPAIERARFHAALAHSQARYHELFQQAGDAVFLIDAAAMAIVAANPAAEQMSGYNQAELNMLAPARLLTSGPRGHVPADVVDALVAGAREYEGYIRTRSGYNVPVSIGATTVLHEDSRYLLLVVRNIGEQQQQSQRLAQSEKLAGMNRLTAAVAHEINNPLQALQNTLHLLLKPSFTDEKRERLLNLAQIEVDRLATIVRRMLELHRPAHADMRPVSIHGLLEGALASVADQIQQHQILLERDWAANLPRVLGIGGHLKQVFLDLVANAVEAMPNGGRLKIRTRLEDASNGEAARVLIEFVDNGPGIAEGEIHLIFEPFYTTKRTNTGLGLAISYSIVERHGGLLSVSSTGDGTTFRITLPAAVIPAPVPLGTPY
jgi:two-component system, NtrC family, sensor kinase